MPLWHENPNSTAATRSRAPGPANPCRNCSGVAGGQLLEDRGRAGGELRLEVNSGVPYCAAAPN